MDLMNIQLLVQEFYAIEAITAMLSLKYNSFEPMRHSHSRWYRDFSDFRDEYTIKFASAIYDYTVSVVSAELRHCRDKASKYIKEYYNSWDQSREEVYDVSPVYMASDILLAGIRMFDTKLVEWRRGFGGDKWKQIAKAGLIKGTVSDCVFIDHCVDLSHNSSIYFDKSAGIFLMQDKEQYQSFLNLKCSCEPQTLINEKRSYKFNKLLWRAKNLNIIEGQQLDGFFSDVYDEAESLLFGYQPVKWGDKRLDYSEGNTVTRTNLDCRMRRVYDREYDQAA